MKKIFLLLLTITIIVPNIFIVTPKVKAVGPTLTVDLTAKKYAAGTSYSDSTSVATGDVVVFLATVTNTASGTTSQDTTLQAAFPTTYTNNHTITFNVTSSNTSGTSDTTLVSITDTTGRLELKPNTTLLTWDTGSGTVNNAVLPDNITSSGGINFGNLIDGSSHAITLIFQANVVPAANPTSAPTPTSAPSQSSGSSGSLGSSSSSQPQPCNDSKPGKTILNTVTRITSTSVKLVWSKAENTNNYAISYGTGSKSYQYGVDRTSNITEYMINDLDPLTSYYFSVMPINGCTPGELSNELSVKPAFIAQASDQELNQTKTQLGTSSAKENEKKDEDKKESIVDKPQKNTNSKQPRIFGPITKKGIATAVATTAIIGLFVQNALKSSAKKVRVINEKTIFKALTKPAKKTPTKKKRK